MPDSGPRLAEDETTALTTRGYVLCDQLFAGAEEAFTRARSLIEDRDSDEGPLSIIGDFVLPPSDGPPTRDFQTLHFDFGLPLDPEVNHDVACYTALYIPADARHVSAATQARPVGGAPEPANVAPARGAARKASGLWPHPRWPGRSSGIRRGESRSNSGGGSRDAARASECEDRRPVSVRAGVRHPRRRAFVLRPPRPVRSRRSRSTSRWARASCSSSTTSPLHTVAAVRAPPASSISGSSVVATSSRTGQRELRERVLGAFSAAADSRAWFRFRRRPGNAPTDRPHRNAARGSRRTPVRRPKPPVAAGLRRSSRTFRVRRRPRRKRRSPLTAVPPSRDPRRGIATCDRSPRSG